MSATATVLQQFVSRLKSRNEDLRAKAAKDLQHYVITELREVLVLRELAVSTPTFFFQQVQPFFDDIFYAVWDSKQAIHEGAVSALRACLILTTQRETKEMQKPQWYKYLVELPGVSIVPNADTGHTRRRRSFRSYSEESRVRQSASKKTEKARVLCPAFITFSQCRHSSPMLCWGCWDIAHHRAS
ncbi:serine/threonine-protein kinase Tor-like isoform X2 [Cyprinus carpio]|uniref:Serine/threonine-protein kinase Tor-like isoform X2 n=1 Tax=Cyprinus carpio TaxID=7962 RepID=A0A9Q9WMS5_CYPCA|nr:serine/threonine-protein kinase Tor-like isoform X2 [Cyprinus carpio]